MNPAATDVPDDRSSRCTIAIGIFAHNEERAIERTIGCILRQSIVRDGAWDVRLLVLVNGSSDRTAELASDTLRQFPPSAALSWDVCVLAEGGKSRTWNRYVHEFAPASAEFLFFTDADIELPDESTFSDMLAFLKGTPAAAICTSRPTKEVELRRARTPFEWATKRISELAQNPSSARRTVSGSLYCLRGDEARKLALPVGLLGEDGYVRTAVSTAGFRAAPDDTRLDRCPTARHVFTQVTGLAAYFSHERRLMMGTLQNQALWKLVERRPAGVDPSDFVHQENRRDPSWARTALIESRRGRSLWKTVRELSSSPLLQLRHQRPLRRLALLPIALLRCTLSALVCVSTERAIAQGRISW